MIGLRVAGRTARDPGRPTQLTDAEERVLVERAMLLGEWGFPLTFRDFRELVKSYLEKAGRTTIFKKNLPSKHFVYHFLRRHPDLSFRAVNNIKWSRAKVTREDVLAFFTNYSKVAAGVPATHIWNYDETNARTTPAEARPCTGRGPSMPRGSSTAPRAPSV